MTIGAYTTIAEAAVVGLPVERTGEVVLGDHVVIDSGAHVEAAVIGSGTEIGIRTSIGVGAVIGKV